MKTQTLTLLPALAGLALALLTLPAPAPAQWTNDPWNGMAPVCTAEGAQQYIRICRLGNGNTLISWCDYRSSTQKVYYQVLNTIGMPLLETNCRPIFEGNWITGWGLFEGNELVPDGQGGSIAVVADYRNGYADIYGQRFDSFGNRLWGETGLPLMVWPGTGDIGLKDVAYDSLGNFFISCVLGSDIYMQKFLADGTRLWGEYGVPVCVGEPNTQEFQKSVPDMTGGIIDTWRDSRFGVEELNFFAQHLDANGNALWANNGIPLVDPLSGMPLWGFLCGGVTDGAGGAIYTYDNYYDWFIIRLGSSGEVLWRWGNYYASMATPGSPVRHPADSSYWVVTQETRTGVGEQNYLYRLDVSGNLIFPFSGIPMGGQMFPEMVETEDGCMIFSVSWANQQTRLFAQRRDSTGALIWRKDVAMGGYTPSGGPVFYNPQSIPIEQNEAICVWEDLRNTQVTNHDIYAQRVRSDGSLGNPMPPPPYAPDWPHYKLSMQGSLIQFVLPTAGRIALSLFDLLGRKVAALAEGNYSAGEHQINLSLDALPSGLYFMQLETPQGRQILKLPVVK